MRAISLLHFLPALGALAAPNPTNHARSDQNASVEAQALAESSSYNATTTSVSASAVYFPVPSVLAHALVPVQALQLSDNSEPANYTVSGAASDISHDNGLSEDDKSKGGPSNDSEDDGTGDDGDDEDEDDDDDDDEEEADDEESDSDQALADDDSDTQSLAANTTATEDLSKRGTGKKKTKTTHPKTKKPKTKTDKPKAKKPSHTKPVKPAHSKPAKSSQTTPANGKGGKTLKPNVKYLDPNPHPNSCARKLKRSSGLAARGPKQAYHIINVSMNEAKHGGPNDRLQTDSLVTCVALVAMAPGGQKALTHFDCGAGMEQHYNTFMALLEANNMRNRNTRIQGSIPDKKTAVVQGAPANFNEGMQQLQDAQMRQLEGWLIRDIGPHIIMAPRGHPPRGDEKWSGKMSVQGPDNEWSDAEGCYYKAHTYQELLQ